MGAGLGREFTIEKNAVRFIGPSKLSRDIEDEFRASGYKYRETWGTEGWEKLGLPDFRKMYLYENDNGEKRYYASDAS